MKRITLVHLTTGYRLIGNVYNLDVDGDGNQTLATTANPLKCRWTMPSRQTVLLKLNFKEILIRILQPYAAPI